MGSREQGNSSKVPRTSKEKMTTEGTGGGGEGGR